MTQGTAIPLVASNGDSAEPLRSNILDFAKTAFEKLSSSVTDEVVGAANELGKLAEKGTIRFLLAFGGGLMVASLVTKVEIHGFHVAKTEPKEFISMMIVGLLLIMGGVFFDLYTYHREMNIYEEDQKANRERHKLAADVAQTGMRALAGAVSAVGSAVTSSIEDLTRGQESGVRPERH